MTAELSTKKPLFAGDCNLGRSKLSAPVFGLGCGPLGGIEKISDDHVRSVLETAWDTGIRYFDTSPWYGNTHSEHRVGNFLRSKTRDSFKLTSKVGRLYKPVADEQAFAQSKWAKRWPGGLPFEPYFDFTRGGILRSYEDSIMRLGLPRIDGLAIHDLDTRHQNNEEGVKRGFDQLVKEGGYEALRELKRNGDISAIGAGINFPGLIPRFLERFEIDYFILAMPYTLLDQQALLTELPACLEAGSSVLIGAPFASGILATGAIEGAQYAYSDASESVIRKVKAIEVVCAQHGVALPAAALQFPLAHPAVAGVIPGAVSAEHIRQNAAAFLQKIPQAFWQQLKSKDLLPSEAPLPHIA